MSHSAVPLRRRSRRRSPAPAPTGLRSFGVEEELLVVDASTLLPAARGDRIAAETGRSTSSHRLTTEFKREQVEVVSPPQWTLAGQLQAIRAGREFADAAAAQAGARVVPLSTSPWPATTTLVRDPRFDSIAERFGITAAEQLTCGFHVHVGVASPHEGVAALDRLRVWLPVLLALSANSPFWMGLDTGFASYRYQAWSRWPTAGPLEVLGTPEAYERHCAELLSTGVPLDDGMLYFDARLSARYPTLEVRIADVCFDPEHAVAIAAITRALVETCVRQWRAGGSPPRVSSAVLAARTWQASRFGTSAELIDPQTGSSAPAAAVVAGLLELIEPVLAEYGELDEVTRIVGDVVTRGTGADRQRSLHRDAAGSGWQGDLRAVIAGALADRRPTVRLGRLDADGQPAGRP